MVLEGGILGWFSFWATCRRSSPFLSCKRTYTEDLSSLQPLISISAPLCFRYFLSRTYPLGHSASTSYLAEIALLELVIILVGSRSSELEKKDSQQNVFYFLYLLSTSIFSNLMHDNT